MKFGAIIVSVMTGVLGFVFATAGYLSTNNLVMYSGILVSSLGVVLTKDNIVKIKKQEKKAVTKNFDEKVNVFESETEKESDKKRV